jgi:hypothetical protein
VWPFRKNALPAVASSKTKFVKVAVGATVPVQVVLKAFVGYIGSVSYDQLLTTLQNNIIAYFI